MEIVLSSSLHTDKTNACLRVHSQSQFHCCRQVRNCVYLQCILKLIGFLFFFYYTRDVIHSVLCTGDFLVPWNLQFFASFPPKNKNYTHVGGCSSGISKSWDFWLVPVTGRASCIDPRSTIQSKLWADFSKLPNYYHYQMYKTHNTFCDPW